MAKKQGLSKTGIDKSRTFLKGLTKDTDPSFIQDGMWTHARNAVNNTKEGDLGTLSNEESNKLSIVVGADIAEVHESIIVGVIALYSGKWAIFTAIYDGFGSKVRTCEIGLFEEEFSTYRPIVRDRCLNFTKFNLISGASREKEDCSWQIYWADGLNPDRYINIGDPKLWPNKTYAWLGGLDNTSTVNYYSNGIDVDFLWPGVGWKEHCVIEGTNTVIDETDPNNEGLCISCIPVNSLNCDAIRLTSFVKTPCIDLKLGNQQGVIENGSYAFAIAYVIDRQIVTNFFSLSNIQPIYNEINERGSLELTVDADSKNFDEFVLVVARFTNQNSSLKQIGYFSTRSTNIVIDQIPETLPTVQESQVLQVNPVFETSKQITEASRFLLRIGPISKFDFNYQPLANLIKAKWVSVEYPEDYYIKGGKNAGYLRDEVYAFFIRWVYDTGDKSASYHIPGRAPRDYGTTSEIDTYSDLNTLTGENYLFETINTGSYTGNGNTPDPIDSYGGRVIAEGDMGYWQSTERYPDNLPEIWNSSYHCWTKEENPDYDLCAKPIRHHRFPDNSVNPNAYHFDERNGQYFIRLMGVSFEDITLPKDNDGKDIKGIVGYEILRSSRHGNKSIVAKGMVNNFRNYELPGKTNSESTVGLYANYPFNCIRPLENTDDDSDDDYGFNDPYIISQKLTGALFDAYETVNQSLPQDLVSFHSPDTAFRNPYLSMTELKVYGHLQGTAEQRFIEPNGHPQFKLLANSAVLIGAVAGIANAILKIVGEIEINYPAGEFTKTKTPVLANGSTVFPIVPASFQMNLIDQGTASAANAALYTSLQGYFGTIGPITDAIAGTDLLAGFFKTSQAAVAGTGNIAMPVYNKKYTASQLLPPFLAGLGGVGEFLFLVIEGANTATKLLYEIITAKQYALEQISYGDYTDWVEPPSSWPSRFKMAEGIYQFNDVQNFPEFQNQGGGSVRYRINNTNRPDLTVLRTEGGNGENIGPRFIYDGGSVLNPDTASIDTSLMTLGNAKDAYSDTLGVNYKPNNKILPFTNTIASNYAGLKFSIRNQYGQLESIQQIIASNCEQHINFNDLAIYDYAETVPNCITPLILKKISKTPVFFGGDTYINRFTEKNIMPFFYNWLFNVAENTPYNYFLSPSVPYPRYWVNSEQWDFSEIYDVDNILDALAGSSFGSGLLPSSYHNLDGIGLNFLSVKNDYFYLANNGIRDFFVESEILVDFRERGSFAYEEFYSKYRFTDLEFLFNMDPEILTRGNKYIYDYSLSSSRFIFNQYFTQGVLQNRNYDPVVADLCFTSYPNRINYSLPQVKEDTTDGWLTYLPNNKVVFRSDVNSVKNFAKTGLFITFEDSGPLIYPGVDERETYVGVAVTIGDGGLFAATPTSANPADKKFEYGSSQDRLGIISSPAGLYYISQQQGKVFSYGQGLTEVSQTNMKWWFNEFLPYKLTEDFPDFPHIDNPVAGIGCSAGYDNTDGIIYFSKKDYFLKREYKDKVEYLNDDKFSFEITPSNKITIRLGDIRVFEDASWTISFDPKTKQWVSFHDWHPNLYLSGRNKHYTTKTGSIWEHNAGCNNYCNFYNVQYPFELAIPFNTGQQVVTVRSIEYYLECFRRDNEFCVDQFHVLDYNFDKAVIFNSEQVSGYLNLNIFPKNNIALAQEYPKLNFNSVEILVSKEEQKYRFNQFWDITKNRGEFPDGAGYPPTGQLIPNTTRLLGDYTENQIWKTQANGYIQTLNPVNLNYNKAELQRKKFRHYNNFVKFIKNNPQDVNMVVKLVNMKGLYSPR